MDERSQIAESAKRLELELGASVLDRLLRLTEILRTAAVDAGLIAAGDRRRVLERHVVDCLRATSVLSERDHEAMDLGSGAGLPGLVVATTAPDTLVLLVEARRRPVAFLEWAVEDLRLDNARVTHARIEDVPEQADVCFARALAPPESAWRLAAPRLRSGGRLVYFAGRAGLATPRGAGIVSWEVVRSPLLESSGPLVIMTQQ